MIIKTLNKIANQLIEIEYKYINHSLNLNFLTIFSHSDQEFTELVKESQLIGTQIYQNNGPIFRLKEELETTAGKVKVFRIRKPDNERPQIGCGDFEAQDWNRISRDLLKQKNKNIQLIERDEYSMIEIRDESFDTLLYIPSETITDFLNI